MNFNLPNAPLQDSFAHVLQTDHFPSKDEAIVLDAVEGVSIQNYVTAIGKLTDPKNIRFVSRISNGRVCLYFNNKEIVDRLTVSTTKVNIDSYVLEIRPLITKSKRIILSNVCPIIPHSIIMKEFEKIGISPSSQITFIRAGINETGYTHILSFRRQVYIKPEDVSKLPETFQINYDDTNYWIYLSADKLICFLCKEEGHVAKFCKNVDQLNKEMPTSQDPVKDLSTQIQSSQSITSENDTFKSSSVETREHVFTQPEVRNKRFLSSSQSAGSSQTDIKTKTLKKVRKNSKSEITPEQIASMLLPVIKKIDENESDYPLNSQQLIELMHSSYEKRNIREIASKYTHDVTVLIDMLSEIKNDSTERKLKYRITKIINCLQSSNNDITSEESSAMD